VFQISANVVRLSVFLLGVAIFSPAASSAHEERYKPGLSLSASKAGPRGSFRAVLLGSSERHGQFPAARFGGNRPFSAERFQDFTIQPEKHLLPGGGCG
jgi:hypothetical protein